MWAKKAERRQYQVHMAYMTIDPVMIDTSPSSMVSMR